MRSLSEVMINVRSMDEVPFDQLSADLKRDAYSCIRGVFSPEEIISARERMRSVFDAKNDRKHDPKDADAIRNNFQKLQVGGTKGVNGCARFLRMFYNPTFCEDIYGMREIFKRLITFRNHLYSLPPDFTINGIENEMWSASRVNHYPKGGGFMAPHADTGTANIAQHLGMSQYVQLILIMSVKGTDFKEGGAYIYDEHGNRIFYEDECMPGDIMIYDGRIYHGVEEIDPMEPLDLNSFDGRHVAMVTLFKYFSSKDVEKEYKQLHG
jgi:hypothetical protein